MSDPLEAARKLAEAAQNTNDDENVNETPETNEPEVVEQPAVVEVPLDAQVPVNSGYLAPPEVPEDEYHGPRDGGLEGERRTVKQGFVISTHLDPQRQRDPHGVYLDDVQRAKAEVVRARAEGREPDFENPGVTAGQVVYTEDVAKLHAQPDARVVPDFTADVVVGDYERDADGNPVSVEDDETE